MSQVTDKASDPVVGVIGGSGVYDIDGLDGVRWEKVDSPFGTPSDELLFGTLGTQAIVFLPRHGRGHRLPPSEVTYRANIDVLKRAGVTDILSVSAVGSRRVIPAALTAVRVTASISSGFASIPN